MQHNARLEAFIDHLPRRIRVAIRYRQLYLLMLREREDAADWQRWSRTVSTNTEAPVSLAGTPAPESTTEGRNRL